MTELSTSKNSMRRFLSDYGMIVGLLALCLYFSFATITVQYPEASEAAEQVTRKVLSARPIDGVVIVVGQKNADGEEFVAQTVKVLKAGGMTKVEQVVGAGVDVFEIAQLAGFDGVSESSEEDAGVADNSVHGGAQVVG
ncbi:MAG: hypothetical protein QGH94_04010, partial [Phycisphaerae bacterium]|nr:hypothetical protein [Phycisphaerae bacterium]